MKQRPCPQRCRLEQARNSWHFSLLPGTARSTQRNGLTTALCRLSPHPRATEGMQTNAGLSRMQCGGNSERLTKGLRVRLRFSSPSVSSECPPKWCRDLWCSRVAGWLSWCCSSVLTCVWLRVVAFCAEVGSLPDREDKKVERNHTGASKPGTASQNQRRSRESEVRNKQGCLGLNLYLLKSQASGCQHGKVAVQADELVVGARLDQPAVGQHEDLVRVSDGGEPVRHCDGRLAHPGLLHGLLHQKLVGGVQGRGRLVQEPARERVS